VELRPAVQPHVGVGQRPRERQRRAIGAHERPAAHVLVRHRLAEPVGGRADRAAQQERQLGQERLAELPPLVAQLVGLEVRELLPRGLHARRRVAELALEEREHGRHVVEVAALQHRLKEPPQLVHADARELVLLEPVVVVLCCVAMVLVVVVVG